MKIFLPIISFLLLLSGPAHAHTAMNKFWGEVPVDMLLTGDVLIVRPLIVPEGVTLTIDSSAVVRFEKSAKGDNRIVVKGKFIAVGEKGKTISFIPKDKDSGLWKGIEFAPTAQGRLENCILEKSISGIIDPQKRVKNA